MDPNTGAAFENNQLELKPVAVTRWTARLVDGVVEQSYLDSRFRDDRRRVLVLMGFIAGAGILIVVGRLLAYLDGHGSLFGLWQLATRRRRYEKADTRYLAGLSRLSAVDEYDDNLR